MDRKNITIREDQSEWVEEADLNLSQFVQEKLDEQMGPSADELAEAYEANAASARKLNETWEDVSREANDYLGEPPATE